ncbi:ankyrin repeat domain-containing protein 37 [Macrotis lagotis]|uniref:ankyrin repeat domain-containing protein 37 n=1 Tax=Macrotis lagotis TaxID=92651 RepID=UPI003D6965A1
MLGPGPVSFWSGRAPVTVWKPQENHDAQLSSRSRAPGPQLSFLGSSYPRKDRDSDWGRSPAGPGSTGGRLPLPRRSAPQSRERPQSLPGHSAFWGRAVLGGLPGPVLPPRLPPRPLGEPRKQGWPRASRAGTSRPGPARPGSCTDPGARAASPRPLFGEPRAPRGGVCAPAPGPRGGEGRVGEEGEARAALTALTSSARPAGAGGGAPRGPYPAPPQVHSPKRLLESGCAVNAPRDTCAPAPAHLAAPAFLLWPLLAGADLNQQDTFGEAPIHKAAKLEAWNACLLVASDALIDLPNKNGQTAEDLAWSCGFLECAKFLTTVKHTLNMNLSKQSKCSINTDNCILLLKNKRAHRNVDNSNGKKQRSDGRQYVYSTPHS